MAGITFEVLEKFGILSESPSGWTKELRLMNWNNRGPRYDLREWAPGDRKASRGITLSLKEMRLLQEILVETEFPEVQDEAEDMGMMEAGALRALAEPGGDEDGGLRDSAEQNMYKRNAAAKKKVG